MKHFIVLCVMFVTGLCAMAQEYIAPDNYLLKEVVVTSTTDTLVRFRSGQYAGTAYTLNEELMGSMQAEDSKTLSLFVPNFYIPDYGSATTSSIYVRGIGSRMNEPAVGLYLDGVPVMNKSAYDMGLYNIANIHVGVGPQGTLYGRNTIGGVVDVKTINPQSFDGKLHGGADLSYGSFNTLGVKTSLLGGTQKFGWHAAGHYDRTDGDERNMGRNELLGSEGAGGKFGFIWNLPAQFMVETNVLYDHLEQDAYPYIQDAIDEVAYNDYSGYDRDFVLASLGVRKKIGTHHTLTSTTGYQYLDDLMRMDNDYTEDSIFALRMAQRQHSWTEEFSFRSNYANYKQLTGVFGFWQSNHIKSPMTLESGMVKNIQGYLDAAHAKVIAAGGAMPTIVITSNEMAMPSHFETSNRGLAGFHQSTFTFFDHLNATIGARVEYERTDFDWNSSYTYNYNLTPPSAPPFVKMPKSTGDTIEGDTYKEFWQVLPKFNAQYVFNRRYNMYATVAKGHKAGGYNTSTIAGILQGCMMEGHGGVTTDVEKATYYKPETTWNYEVGFHGEWMKNKLFTDMSVFYIDYNNSQLSVPSQYGTPTIVNAEGSMSCGLEASVRYMPVRHLTLMANYGYTHSQFNDDYKELNDAGETVNCKKNDVPFVPHHTVSVLATYKKPVSHCSLLDEVAFSAGFKGLGSIYWDAVNEHRQDFYGSFHFGLDLSKGNFTLSGYVKDISTDAGAATFAFRNAGKWFHQETAPLIYGGALAYSF